MARTAATRRASPSGVTHRGAASAQSRQSPNVVVRGGTAPSCQVAGPCIGPPRLALAQFEVVRAYPSLPLVAVVVVVVVWAGSPQSSRPRQSPEHPIARGVRRSARFARRVVGCLCRHGCKTARRGTSRSRRIVAVDGTELLPTPNLRCRTRRALRREVTLNVAGAGARCEIHRGSRQPARPTMGADAQG